MMNNICNINYLVVDVDGTMTDGGIYYDENGSEVKKFSVKDAAAFFLLHERGIKIVVITGRECKATERRMIELKVDYLYQNIKNKKDFLASFMMNNEILKEEMAYIGDDLNDVGAMRLCKYMACPSDACKEIKETVNYISEKKGGEGAVRDCVENFILGKQLWEQLMNKVYG